MFRSQRYISQTQQHDFKDVFVSILLTVFFSQHVCMWITYVSPMWMGKPEEVSGPLESVAYFYFAKSIRNSLPCGCWEPNIGLPEEPRVLLTVELSLQPYLCNFKELFWSILNKQRIDHYRSSLHRFLFHLSRKYLYSHAIWHTLFLETIFLFILPSVQKMFHI